MLRREEGEEGKMSVLQDACILCPQPVRAGGRPAQGEAADGVKVASQLPAEWETVLDYPAAGAAPQAPKKRRPREGTRLELYGGWGRTPPAVPGFKDRGWGHEPRNVGARGRWKCKEPDSPLGSPEGTSLVKPMLDL